MRLHSFREGDRSEYLANYLLSGMGLVTAVPRQEDEGFDFYCNLADQEKGYLNFGYPFIIQLKSDSISSILYGKKDHDEWRPDHYQWLKNLRLPFFVGIVKKKEMEIKIYNTSTLMILFNEVLDPSLVELKINDDLEWQHIGRFTKEALEGWPAGEKGDGFKYMVNLGPPIITLTNSDIYDENVLRSKKAIMRTVIEMKEKNLLFLRQNYPVFFWVEKIRTNTDPGLAYYYGSPITPADWQGHLDSLVPGVLSLARNSMLRGDIGFALTLKPLIKKFPIDKIPEKLKEEFPQLFD